MAALGFIVALLGFVPCSLAAAADSSTAPQLWPPWPVKAVSCGPGAGRLAAQNWTDGDPSVPDAGVCRWRWELSSGNAPGLASHLGIPKVAMLFLSMGPLRHEALWAVWFRQAAGLLPGDCAAGAQCSGPPESAQLGGLLADFVGRHPSPIAAQSLFSVYVHLPPRAPLFPAASIFSGTEIANRINSSWGTFDLAQVARNLMAAALEDPLNQRFITVSEACIPLYPPQVVYQQLAYARQSRINACTTRENWARDDYRWTFRMEEATQGRLQKGMWRKNHQWLALTRKHARLTVADVEIAEAFGKHCYSGQDPDFGGWWRTCFSDEHYFSTLLAFHGLDNETDCMGELTHTLWCPWCEGDERLHPHTYTREETSLAKLRELREESDGCEAGKAYASAATFLPSVLDSQAWQAAAWEQEEPYLLLPKCPLFARKFTDDAVAAALHALLAVTVEDDAHLALAGAQPEASPIQPTAAGPAGGTADDGRARPVNEALEAQESRRQRQRRRRQLPRRQNKERPRTSITSFLSG